MKKYDVVITVTPSHPMTKKKRDDGIVFPTFETSIQIKDLSLQDSPLVHQLSAVKFFEQYIALRDTLAITEDQPLSLDDDGNDRASTLTRWMQIVLTSYPILSNKGQVLVNDFFTLGLESDPDARYGVQQTFERIEAIHRERTESSSPAVTNVAPAPQTTRRSLMASIFGELADDSNKLKIDTNQQTSEPAKESLVVVSVARIANLPAPVSESSTGTGRSFLPTFLTIVQTSMLNNTPFSSGSSSSSSSPIAALSAVKFFHQYQQLSDQLQNLGVTEGPVFPTEQSLHNEDEGEDEDEEKDESRRIDVQLSAWLQGVFNTVFSSLTSNRSVQRDALSLLQKFFIIDPANQDGDPDAEVNKIRVLELIHQLYQVRNSTGSAKSSSAGGDPTSDAWQTYLGMSFAQNGLCRETIIHGYLAVCVLRGDRIAKGSNDIKLHMSYETMLRPVPYDDLPEEIQQVVEVEDYHRITSFVPMIHATYAFDRYRALRDALEEFNIFTDIDRMATFAATNRSALLNSAIAPPPRSPTSAARTASVARTASISGGRTGSITSPPAAPIGADGHLVATVLNCGFPRTHRRSSFGIALTDRQLSERTVQLNNWMGLLLQHFPRYPSSAQEMISNFLGLTYFPIVERCDITDVDMQYKSFSSKVYLIMLRAQYPDESRLRTAISSHSTSAILACLPTTTTAGTNASSTPMPIMGFSRSSVTDTVVETIVQGCLSVRVTQGEMLTKDATDSSLHRSYRTIVQILPYDSVELVNKEEELDRTEYNVRFSHIPPIQVMHVFDGYRRLRNTLEEYGVYTRDHASLAEREAGNSGHRVETCGSSAERLLSVSPMQSAFRKLSLSRSTTINGTFPLSSISSPATTGPSTSSSSGGSSGSGGYPIIILDCEFPRTHRRSSFGLALTEKQLVSRTLLLNRWMGLLLQHYPKYPAKVQELISDFLGLTYFPVVERTDISDVDMQYSSFASKVYLIMLRNQVRVSAFLRGATLAQISSSNTVTEVTTTRTKKRAAGNGTSTVVEESHTIVEGNEDEVDSRASSCQEHQESSVFTCDD